MAMDDERRRRLAEQVLQEQTEIERRQRESAGEVTRREKQASDDSARIVRDIEDKQRDWTPPKK